MANKAHNFAFTTAQAWERPHAEHNAVRRAQQQGATRVRAFNVDHYREEPGDNPGSLWQWPDGSEYVIGDNGSYIQAPRHRGAKAYNEG